MHGEEKSLLDNPLYLERYSESMVDRLTELEIQKDPILENGNKKTYIERTKKKWLEISRKARNTQLQTRTGEFHRMQEYVRGEVLLMDHTLYIGTLFETDAGPELHIYLTTVLDPRDHNFPDETSVDLGLLKSPFGTQYYDVPESEHYEKFRTVVLWDKALDRLYGFAQLAR